MSVEAAYSVRVWRKGAKMQEKLNVKATVQPFAERLIGNEEENNTVTYKTSLI
jgi:hypothetical protein